MCIIGRQLIEKSGLLILVNFINLVNLGLQYLSCCWFAPYDTVAPAGVRHTPAGAVTHRPCAGSQLHFHQSFPHAPTGVSEFVHCGRDDDSQKPTWQRDFSVMVGSGSAGRCSAGGQAR